MGQFACLLPTLVVVAVSQAPSPESNPDSPLPVTAMVVLDTTIKADRSEVLCDQAMLWQATTLPARVSNRTSLSQPNTLPFPGAGLQVQLGVIHCLVEQAEACKTLGVADLVSRVLATRFWRVSNRATWQVGPPHSITEMPADVRSHSQTHC